MSRLPDSSFPDVRDSQTRVDPRVPGDDGPRRPALPEPRPEVMWAALDRPGEAETWRKVFPGTTRQVSDARRLAQMFLDDTTRAGDAAWITGELAANAVRHTRSGVDGGMYVLELSRLGEVARIVVYDLGGGGRPVFTRPLTALNLSEHGYGLLAITQLADRAGVRGNPAVGHAVWAELLLDG